MVKIIAVGIIITKYIMGSLSNSGLTKKNTKLIKRLVNELQAASSIDENAVYKEIAGAMLTFTSIEDKEKLAMLTGYLNDVFSLLNEKFHDKYVAIVMNLYSLSTSNPIIIANMIDVYAEQKNYPAIVDLFRKDHELQITPHVIEILRGMCDSPKNSSMAASLISSRGIYDETILEKCSQHCDSKVLEDVIKSYSSIKDDRTRVLALKFFWDKVEDAKPKLDLVELLLSANSGDLKFYTESFPVEQLRTKEECEQALQVLKRSGTTEILERAIDKCMLICPDNVTVLKADADNKYSRGDIKKALKIYRQILKSSPEDLEVLQNVIDITFSEGLYKECLNLISNSDILQIKGNNKITAIECEINLLQFQEALHDLESALAASPDNLKLLALKLGVSEKIGRILESYETAKKIFNIDRANISAMNYLCKYYVDRREFEKLVELLGSIDNIPGNFRGFYAGSLLFEGKIKDAMTVMQSYPELLTDGFVLDAIYAKVTDSVSINQLSEISRKLSGGASEFKLIVDALYGRPIMHAGYEEMAMRTSSLAVMYVITNSYYKDNAELSTSIEKRLRLPEFEKLYSVLKSIREIRSGMKPESLFDYSDLGYPVCNALLDMNMTDKCEQLFSGEKYDKNNVHYMYVRARIFAAKKQMGEAEKILTNLRQIIDSLEFSRILLLLDLEKGDKDEFYKTVVNMKKEGGLVDNDIEVIRKAIKQTNHWDFAEVVIGLFGSEVSDSPAMLRLNRDFSLHSNELEKALELSGKIMSSMNFSPDDLKIHVSLMQTAYSTKDILKLLEDIDKKHSDPEIEAIIGDLYYRDKLFNRAYPHYSKAKDLGYDMSRSRNYAEVLLEMKRYDEALTILQICSDSLLLSRLYYETSNISGIIQLIQKLKPTDSDFDGVMDFIVENFWGNPEVRYELIKYYLDGDYVSFGSKIVRKCLSVNDIKTALGIAKGLYGKQPTIENAILYSQALYSSGEKDEAKRVLTKALKKTQDGKLRIDTLRLLYSFLYEDHDTDSILSLYLENPESVDIEILKMVIDSYISTGMVNEAEAIADKFYESILDKDTYTEIKKNIGNRKELIETVAYASKVLKEEYAERKTFSSNEEFYNADIPIDKIAEVKKFLTKKPGTGELSTKDMEQLSAEIIHKLVKNENLKQPSDLTIYLIYHHLDGDDSILAKNLYFYIKDAIQQRRIPVVDDPELKKLTKIATKKYIPLDPIIMASELDIGISKAMDIITLIRYLSEIGNGSEE
ncbi:MAG: CDC27 family protein [Thermoplasmatales archaeon]|nr:CDC27 family protein [Thermoplasmatales archaeon]MCW6170026.1 CDC27 family protein [Thermoplasmatales archaeon]